jgi:hypothetical protein
MLTSVAHPLPIRVLNAAGAALQTAGVRLVPLTPEALVRRAVRKAGLADFGEPDFAEGLAVLCRSAEEDARLSLLGRLVLRDHVTDALVTRLRRIEARRRTPDVFRAPLVPPLIVLGLPRSGTTLLHRLLALDEAARAPLLWELQCPIPGPGPDRRREQALRRVARMRKAAPDLDAKHHVDADEPEEDVFLLDSSLSSPSFWMLAPVYGYLEWLLARDQRPAYRVYREHLQLLQAGSPKRRLTLKAPAHTGNLDALAEAVPEAIFVQAHRDPVTVTISVNSLFHTIHGLVTDAMDVRRMAAVNTELMATLLERGMAARATVAADRVCDVRYRALVADPIGTVRDIYHRADLPFTSAFATRMTRFLAERPAEKFGRHTYAAEDFGLSEERLRSRFRAYAERHLRD